MSVVDESSSGYPLDECSDNQWFSILLLLLFINSEMIIQWLGNTEILFGIGLRARLFGDMIKRIFIQKYELNTYFSDDFNLTTLDDIYLDHMIILK
jgi:hypothetical protein